MKTEGEIESSAAVSSNGYIIWGGNDGILRCADKNGKLIWSYRAKGDITSSPAIIEGRIVAGCEDNTVYCFSEKE
jgi:outer membrane protein assembly factor BamB